MVALFTAKCFWPGVTEDELRLAAARAGSSGRDSTTVFRGALYLPGDELVLCLFESGTRAGVRRASDEAGLPCERVIETVWVGSQARGEQECES